MKVIAFGHRRRTGKDQAAKFLLTILRLARPGLKIAKTSFAYKLKDVCHQIYSWAGMKSPEFYESNGEEKEKVLKPIGKSPRQIWIEFGTPAVREIVYDRTWVDYTLKSNKADVLIITDLRFPNEMNAVQNLDGVCIRIDRASAPRSDDVADSALSRVPIHMWDRIIPNNESLDVLYKQMKQLAGEIVDG